MPMDPPAVQDGDALITPAQLCKKFPFLSPSSLCNWRNLGEGPAFYKIGRRVLYRIADVENWIASRRVEGGTDD